MRGIEQRPDRFVFRFAEAGVFETHARGQKTEDIHVRFRLAGRGERGPGKLQIVMAVCRIQVRVLQESGNGQQDVGVVGGIGLELLQHHRK